mmetsp:Transcript_30840/g.65231  ORF Transcript_30840/g.65231 Transcript_30840/m.65231 type:complete len:93 (-) Transcript_30840:9-287(-)
MFEVVTSVPRMTNGIDGFFACCLLRRLDTRAVLIERCFRAMAASDDTGSDGGFAFLHIHRTSQQLRRREAAVAARSHGSEEDCRYLISLLLY